MRCTAERRDHRYSDGALPVRREWHAVGPHEHGLAEHSGGCHPGARPDRLCARASLVTFVSQDTPPQVTDCAGDSRLNLCHKTTFHNFSCYFLKQFGTGKPCVICQDKTRLVEFPLRAGVGARCVRQKVQEPRLPGCANGSNWPPPSRGCNAFVLVPHSHDKTSRLCARDERCWTLAEDIILEWEQRKKSRAGGGASFEPRKECVILEVYVVRDSTPAARVLGTG